MCIGFVRAGLFVRLVFYGFLCNSSFWALCIKYAVGKSTGYDYSRLQNPTREHIEKVVASLENGTDAFAFTSGMAAISLLMETFCPGDYIIADSDLYGGSIRLFRNVSEKTALNFQISTVVERI